MHFLFAHGCLLSIKVLPKGLAASNNTYSRQTSIYTISNGTSQVICILLHYPTQYTWYLASGVVQRVLRARRHEHGSSMPFTPLFMHTFFYRIFSCTRVVRFMVPGSNITTHTHVKRGTKMQVNIHLTSLWARIAPQCLLLFFEHADSRCKTRWQCILPSQQRFSM